MRYKAKTSFSVIRKGFFLLLSHNCVTLKLRF